MISNSFLKLLLFIKTLKNDKNMKKEDLLTPIKGFRVSVRQALAHQCALGSRQKVLIALPVFHSFLIGSKRG